MERVLNGRSGAVDAAAAASFNGGTCSLPRSPGGRQPRFIAKTIIMLFLLFGVAKVPRHDSENEGETLLTFELESSLSQFRVSRGRAFALKGISSAPCGQLFI